MNNMPNPSAGEGVVTEDSQNNGSGEDRQSRTRFFGRANTRGQRGSSRSRSSSPLGARRSSIWRDFSGEDSSSDEAVCYDCKKSVGMWRYDKDERMICDKCGLKRKISRGPNHTASDQLDSGSGLRTNTRSPGRLGGAEQPEETPGAVGSSTLWDAATSSHTAALSMAGFAKQKLARFFLEVSEDGLAYGDEDLSCDSSSEDGRDIVRSNASTPAPLPSPFEISDDDKLGERRNGKGPAKQAEFDVQTTA